MFDEEEKRNPNKYSNVNIDDYRDSTINVAELLSTLRDKYGDLDDERGCFANGSWLSVYNIVNIITKLADDNR